MVVSAGGTQEAIDPVRYVGNHSSGKMGYAIAEALRDRGAEVTLISGASALPRSLAGAGASGHQRAGDGAGRARRLRWGDALIMAAAVADFRPETVAAQKIKKSSPDAALDLHLVQNPDVLQAVHRAYGDLVKVGFVAESRDVLAEAGRKLVAKGLHLICANDVTEEGSGFGTDTNRVTSWPATGRGTTSRC